MTPICKNRLINAVLILPLIFSPTLAADEHEADRSVLKGMLQQVEKALNARNLDAIKPLLHDDVVITFVNAEVTRGVENATSYYQRVVGQADALISDYATSATVSEPARFHGDLAIADGTADDRYTLKTGKKMDMQVIWTAIMRKENDIWKIAQLHFSANPFSNPIISGLKNSLIYSAAGAGLVALLIGYLLGRFGSSRRKSP